MTIAALTACGRARSPRRAGPARPRSSRRPVTVSHARRRDRGARAAATTPPGEPASRAAGRRGGDLLQGAARAAGGADRALSGRAADADLMAATYPLEIVAGRPLHAAPTRTSRAPTLEEALKEQDWDPSVKSPLHAARRAQEDEREPRLDAGPRATPSSARRTSCSTPCRGCGARPTTPATSRPPSSRWSRSRRTRSSSSSRRRRRSSTFRPTRRPWSTAAGRYPSYYYPPMYPYYPSGYGLVDLRRRHRGGRRDLGRLRLGLGPQRRQHRRSTATTTSTATRTSTTTT